MANDKPFSNLRYHVPREWLKPSGNLLVVFEEFGGNPGGISLVKRFVWYHFEKLAVEAPVCNYNTFQIYSTILSLHKMLTNFRLVALLLEMNIHI